MNVFTGLGLPRSVIAAVEQVEEQIKRNLDIQRVSYERDGCLLSFKRAVAPMLLTLATATDSQGAPDEQWLCAYARDRAEKEAQIIVDAAIERQRQAIAFSVRHFSDARGVFHSRERDRLRAKEMAT